MEGGFMSESVDGRTAEPVAANNGRYLYCLVNVDVDGEGPDEPVELGATGIEGNAVSVVAIEDVSVGAVVHDDRSPYNSEDPAELRDWLLAHQRVVEAAGDRFGTPLPVRFDTVIEGGDDAVAGWLAQNAEPIVEAFDAVTGRWEYRVTLFWDPTKFEESQRTADPELADIDSRLGQCDPGKRFLLRKQYDQRLRELTEQRRETLQDRLVNRLAAESARVTERPLRSEAAASLGVEPETDAVAQVAVLASRDNESALGDVLDRMTDSPGVDVRFTGPWPPYTFAPTIADD